MAMRHLRKRMARPLDVPDKMSVLPLKTTWYFPPLLIALGGYFHGLDSASSGTVDAPADDDADRYVCVA